MIKRNKIQKLPIIHQINKLEDIKVRKEWKKVKNDVMNSIRRQSSFIRMFQRLRSI